MVKFDEFGPEKIIEVYNAKVGMRGILCIDNTALGPGKGGIRMTSTVSVEEVSRLVKETGCSFCIDFAHILARDKNVEYEKIEKLFPWREWHVHFSGIVYGEKGEKHHRETKREEWLDLLKNLPKDKRIRIINESPTMIKDSVAGLKIAKQLELLR